MKAHLMHRTRDFDVSAGLPDHTAALIQDLELGTLVNAMADGDEFVFDMARRAVLSSLPDPDGIRYRQDVLADCLRLPDVVRELYGTAVEAIQAEKRNFLGMFGRSPGLILHRAVEVLDLLVGTMRKLRRITDQHAGQFRSEGFVAFFEMLAKELGDTYLREVTDHLARLRFDHGILVSAALGRGNKGTGYTLRRPHPKERWRRRISGGRTPSYTYRIPERDEAGAQALGELRGRGLNLVADALARSNDHILAFLTMLRSELAFYVGCVNLHDRLTGKGEPVCVPVPGPLGSTALAFDGLYDPCLSLNVGDRRVVGNRVAGDDLRLLMITGANQGGKSTFLRSLGVAQLMMQCGMFVPAERFEAGVCENLFTHFKREEDASMRSGKLDEELSRMSGIVDRLSPNGFVLFNESFAATNEREGSQIATQVIRALLDARVRVAFVTHMYDLAHGLYGTVAGSAFLRAERRADGSRTFALVEGEPIPTSFGEDLYQRIFGD